VLFDITLIIRMIFAVAQGIEPYLLGRRAAAVISQTVRRIWMIKLHRVPEQKFSFSRRDFT